MNVSVKEAQEQLPQLLARVEQGEQITITRDGKPVAKLSASPPRDRQQIEATLAQIREIRRGKSMSPQEIKELINEGRRY